MADPLYSDQAKYVLSLTAGQAFKLRPEVTENQWYGFDELDQTYTFASEGTDNNVIVSDTATYEIYLKKLASNGDIKIGLAKQADTAKYLWGTTGGSPWSKMGDLVESGDYYTITKTFALNDEFVIHIADDDWRNATVLTGEDFANGNVTAKGGTGGDKDNIVVNTAGEYTLTVSKTKGGSVQVGDPLPPASPRTINVTVGALTDNVYAWTWKAGGTSSRWVPVTEGALTIETDDVGIKFAKMSSAPEDLSKWDENSHVQTEGAVNITLPAYVAMESLTLTYVTAAQVSSTPKLLFAWGTSVPSLSGTKDLVIVINDMTYIEGHWLNDDYEGQWIYENVNASVGDVITILEHNSTDNYYYSKPVENVGNFDNEDGKVVCKTSGTYTIYLKHANASDKSLYIA